MRNIATKEAVRNFRARALAIAAATMTTGHRRAKGTDDILVYDTEPSAPTMPVSDAPSWNDAEFAEITPRTELSFGLRELWRYHELLYYLTWRDIKVRYKQTLVGFAWVIGQPILMMTVFALFFGRWGRMPSDGVAYPLFVLSGILLWQLFSSGLNESANSLVASERLITKVYFPRLAIPVSAVLSSVVDFLVGSGVLVVSLFFYGVHPTPAIALAPLFVIAAVLAALAAGLWLAAWNVQYRDVRYILGFLAQLWFFATPIVYPSTIVPARWRVLYALNPMTGIIEGFRWAVVGSPQPSMAVLFSSFAATAVMLAGGLVYFHRVDGSFADVI